MAAGGEHSSLTRYISDGRMPIDNNILERDIRVFATGRKSRCLATRLAEPRPVL
jgi:hypothetical protein